MAGQTVQAATLLIVLVHTSAITGVAIDATVGQAVYTTSTTRAGQTRVVAAQAQLVATVIVVSVLALAHPATGVQFPEGCCVTAATRHVVVAAVTRVQAWVAVWLEGPRQA